LHNVCTHYYSTVRIDRVIHIGFAHYFTSYNLYDSKLSITSINSLSLHDALPISYTTTAIISGNNMSHHDQLITPTSFNTTNTIVNTSTTPIYSSSFTLHILRIIYPY